MITDRLRLERDGQIKVDSSGWDPHSGVHLSLQQLLLRPLNVSHTARPHRVPRRIIRSQLEFGDLADFRPRRSTPCVRLREVLDQLWCAQHRTVRPLKGK